MSRSRLVVFISMAVVLVGGLASLGILVLEPARAAVGPLPGEGLSLPADARFVAGFDVKRLTESPFYQKYAPQGGRPDAFADLEARIGLNPERDLDQVLIAGRDGDPGAGVAMVFGRFDRAKLSQAVEAAQGRGDLEDARGHERLPLQGGQQAAPPPWPSSTTARSSSAARPGSSPRSRATPREAAGLKGNAALLALLEQVKPGLGVLDGGGPVRCSRTCRTRSPCREVPAGPPRA